MLVEKKRIRLYYGQQFSNQILEGWLMIFGNQRFVSPQSLLLLLFYFISSSAMICVSDKNGLTLLSPSDLKPKDATLVNT
jgi:hypothetical protein